MLSPTQDNHNYRTLTLTAINTYGLLTTLIWPAICSALPPVVLECREITESSGLAEVAGRVWTHNDSGDTPRFFLFDRNGTHLAIVELDGARAVDWEDLCAFQRDGRQYIAVADAGDNDRRRDHVEIYIAELPSPTWPDVNESRAEGVRSHRLKVVQRSP